MNRDELLEFHDEVTSRCKQIMKNKNNDYAEDESPFANFKAVDDLGVVDTKEGFMVRIVDKFKRITTFINEGELAVKDEPFTDACDDIINYLILLMAYIEEFEKEEN